MLTYNPDDGLLMYGQRIMCEVGFADENFEFLVKAFNDLQQGMTSILVKDIWNGIGIVEHVDQVQSLLLKLREIANG